ncbi:hypothetical protein PoB_001499500 [Plakobranchus ocellatus]|uniref:ATP synthase F0 subunit 8 n=1 Tax=Plakobranchus ocellatus TaxID=259542 RepID=A0AAV3YZ80_9GAST|nr:hypothetical protein PoB_001499500 [Plakobranchus ocellatus]
MPIIQYQPVLWWGNAVLLTLLAVWTLSYTVEKRRDPCEIMFAFKMRKKDAWERFWPVVDERSITEKLHHQVLNRSIASLNQSISLGVIGNCNFLFDSWQSVDLCRYTVYKLAALCR